MKAPYLSRRSDPSEIRFTRKKAQIATGCEEIIDAIDPGF
jgi:hypothetical protein